MRNFDVHWEDKRSKILRKQRDILQERHLKEAQFKVQGDMSEKF